MSPKLFLPAAALVSLLGCNSNDTVAERRAEEARDNAAKAARQADNEAAEARTALSRRIDQLDAEVDRLEAKAKTATGKARKRLSDQAEETRADAKRLRARMSTWDDKASDAWRATKREVEEGLDKTENAIKKLWNDIKD